MNVFFVIIMNGMMITSMGPMYMEQCLAGKSQVEAILQHDLRDAPKSEQDKFNTGLKMFCEER